MDNASVEFVAIVSCDGNYTATAQEPAEPQAEVPPYTVNSGCVWESVHRPLPPAQPRSWSEWAF